MPTEATVCFTTAGLAVVTGLLAALTAAVAKLFFHLMAAKQAQVDDLLEQRDLQMRMTHELLSLAEETLNERRAAEGRPPLAPLQTPDAIKSRKARVEAELKPRRPSGEG